MHSSLERIQLARILVRDLPMLDEFQCGSVHLFHGKVGHAAEMDGALALSAGAAFYSLFDNADARGQGLGGALIGGTENGDQGATGILPVLEYGRGGHGTLPGGSRNRPYENMRRAAVAGMAVAAASIRHSRVAKAEKMAMSRKIGINSVAATWGFPPPLKACQAREIAVWTRG
jgi:hypothetical protein